MGMNSATTTVSLLGPPELTLSDICFPKQLSVEELMRLSQCAYNQYCATGKSDERFAFELFRRAIEEKHERSWQALVELYTPLVTSWICKLEKAMWLLQQDREVVPVLLNACFLKFFLALPPAKFTTFTSLSSLITYLKQCLRSVVYDEFEAQRLQRACEEKGREMGTENLVEDPAETVATTQKRQFLWQRVLTDLRPGQERVILVCVYLWDMKPREISHAYPDLFPAAKEVYLVKQNMLERLRHDQQLQSELLGTLAS